MVLRGPLSCRYLIASSQKFVNDSCSRVLARVRGRRRTIGSRHVKDACRTRSPYCKPVCFRWKHGSRICLSHEYVTEVFLRVTSAPVALFLLFICQMYMYSSVSLSLFCEAFGSSNKVCRVCASCGGKVFGLFLGEYDERTYWLPEAMLKRSMMSCGETK